MFSLLLAVIYAAFISLGLPDALLGSAWPTMYRVMNVPVSYAGIVSMIISCGTVISSLMSDRAVRRLGTHLVTVISVGLTALGLFGFSSAGAFWQLCVWAVPYGLGAGSVDAALNNYIALYYRSGHMNWLHCFWGLGAMAGPYIMGACLTGGYSFGAGYRVVFFIQLALTIVLVLSRPLWKKTPAGEAEKTGGKSFLRRVLKMTGAPVTMLAFFLYCALEGTTGLWAAASSSCGTILRRKAPPPWLRCFTSASRRGVSSAALSPISLATAAWYRSASSACCLVRFYCSCRSSSRRWRALFSSGSAVRPFTLGFCIKRPCASAPKKRRRSWVCRWRAPMSAA